MRMKGKHMMPGMPKKMMSEDDMPMKKQMKPKTVKKSMKKK
jgi:hypothetical protein